MKRVAVVTGGASGMGLEICRHLAKDGHAVAIADRDIDTATSVADELCDAGAEAEAIRIDVADETSVTDGYARVRDAFGSISIVVTSAGIAPYDDFAETTLEQWQRVIDVNLTGTFLCVKAAIADMVDQQWGRIVTISSAAGQWGTARMGHYSASKGGVISLTKALAREYGPHGITANTVPPGLIATPMSRAAQADGDIPPDELVVTRLPLGRIGTAAEIAATCAFLCSDAASYITGQVVAVNGGMVI